MELNINSPAYFTQQYGIVDEVYQFCQKVYLYFKDKEYSDNLHTIGIVPVIAPQEMYDGGAWKESIQFIAGKSCVSITIRMNLKKILLLYMIDKKEGLSCFIESQRKNHTTGKPRDL